MDRAVVVSLTSDKQEFQLSQAAEAERAAAELGFRLEVLFADENAVLQIHQLFERISRPEHERPLALVLEPVKEAGLERLCRNALAAGVGWLLLNRPAPYLARLRAEYPRLPVSNVFVDQVEAGRIQGRQMRVLLPQGGKALFVLGPAVLVTEERRRGTLEVLQDTGITLHEVSGTWTEASGEKAVSGWLRLKAGSSESVDLLACQNDLMAAGGRKALLQARPDLAGIPVLGIDGLPSGGRRLVATQQLTATVVTPANAGQALQLIAGWLRSGQPVREDVKQDPESYPPLVELRPPATRR